MQALTLTLVARILPPLFAVAIGVYVTWCQAIAFVGGTIPLTRWTLEGGFLTALLWALLVSGVVSGLSRIALAYLIAIVGRIIPLTIKTPDTTPPLESSNQEDGPVFARAPEGATAGYHSGFATLCAVASQLAYADDDNVRGTAERLETTGFSVIVEQNHRCLLLAYSDCIIVAFRGTDAGELADWKTNLRHTPTSGPFGRVHSGYLAAVDLMWPRITASVESMRANNQTLLLTGHSMGGALAVVAASKFAADGLIPITGLYTFGQPAVAEPAFETELLSRVEGRYFRFTNSIDMVPNIPVDATFKHGGQQLFIDRGGRIHTTNVLVRMAAARLLTQVLEPETRRAEVDDHGIGEYVRALASSGSLAQRAAGIGGLTRREQIHLWISVALYAAVFVAFCVQTWRAHGSEAFAMGCGAFYTIAILTVMLIWPQEYNDHLLNWYTRQGLIKP